MTIVDSITQLTPSPTCVTTQNQLFEWLQVASRHEDSCFWSSIVDASMSLSMTRDPSLRFFMSRLYKSQLSFSKFLFSIPSFFLQTETFIYFPIILLLLKC